MLKQLVNECVITLQLVPKGPILVKSNVTPLGGPDMGFVRVWRNGAPEVYLPGSSIKGVLRSHAERIARSLVPAGVVIACDPFASFSRRSDQRPPRWESPAFCGACFEKRVRGDGVPKEYRLRDGERGDGKNQEKDEGDGDDGPDGQAEGRDALNRAVCRESCPICRLFGSTMFAGRLATADAYAVGRVPAPQTRDGVGIDRFTGGAFPRAKFDLEVVTEGRFETTLHLRNFELWQLGLVGVLVEDLKDGLIRIGAGKSRGLGKIHGEVTGVDLHYIGRHRRAITEGKLTVAGAGSLIEPAEAEVYGMENPDKAELDASSGVTARSSGVRTIFAWASAGGGDGARAAQDVVLRFPWSTFIDVWVGYAERYKETYRRLDAMRYVRGARA